MKGRQHSGRERLGQFTEILVLQDDECVADGRHCGKLLGCAMLRHLSDLVFRCSQVPMVTVWM